MEISSILFLAALALLYFFYQRHERLRAAVRRYASALAHQGIERAYREDDDAEGLRLQRLANALRRADSMKWRDWRGQLEMLDQTLSAVREACQDGVLAAVELQPGRPGFEESKKAAQAMSARLERMRMMSGGKR